MTPVPTILYVDCQLHIEMERRRLAGMRRYAAARGWQVETLEHRFASEAALREAIDRLHPIGCAAEFWNPKRCLRPALFGTFPVVYFSPSEDPALRNALRVECDEAAVARLAFQELSAGEPPMYAVVSFWKEKRWARERVAAFLDCCDKAGSECQTAFFPEDDAPRNLLPTKSLVSWAASLPPHCAVFAVNDLCANVVADALMRAGRAFPRTATLVGADGTDPSWPGDREIAPKVSSVVLDHEMAGYLAAKALASAFAANDAAPSARMTSRAPRGMTTASCAANDGSRKREMESAACAANDGSRGARNEVPRQQFAPKAHSSFGGRAATLHCGEAASSLPPPPAVAPSLQRREDGVAVFPPLLVVRRQSTRGRGRSEPYILKAMDMIRREACEGLTAAALAARFPGSRRHFEIRFREAIGHPPLDEILNVRLVRAMELLVHTERAISAVAGLSGSPSEWEFWHFFRKRTGMSPFRFRKERR